MFSQNLYQRKEYNNYFIMFKNKNILLCSALTFDCKPICMSLNI